MWCRYEMPLPSFRPVQLNTVPLWRYASLDGDIVHGQLDGGYRADEVTAVIETASEHHPARHSLTASVRKAPPLLSPRATEHGPVR
jgi:hypothetical protein